METNNINNIVNIKLDDLNNFKNHPFKVIENNSDMEELVSSIKESGVIEPLIVRTTKEGKYEIISGHRRKKACELLGIKEIKCIVKDFTDDEAIINMVDSNLKREKLLPSEKAFAYKMKYDALKHQGKTLGQNVPKLRTSQMIANNIGTSEKTIRRFIKLTELIPELLKLVDDERIGLSPAFEISYLTKEEQKILNLCIEEYNCTPSHDQAIRMKNLSEKELLDKDSIEEIMNELKPNQKEYIKLDSQKFRKIMPRNILPDKREEYIYKAIDFYNRYLQKQKEKQR